MLRKFLVILLWLAPTAVLAEGLTASFQGSRLDGLTRRTTVFEQKSIVDSSNNLIDVSGSNLFTYSEQFDNAAWSRTALTTVSSNVIKSPIDNTLVADGLVGTVANSWHGVFRAVTLTASKYTLAVDAKAGNQTWLYLSDFTATASAYFNLSTGAVGTVANLSDYSMQKLNDGWYRCSITFTGTAAAHTLWIYSAEADADNVFTGDAVSINTYLVGAQVSKVDEFTKYPPYLKTTDTAKPRLDLTPAGSPPSGYSDLQGLDGNRLPAKSFNGTTQWYSRGHDNAMNVTDTDFTLTMVAKLAVGDGDATLFYHAWAFNTGGVWINYYPGVLYAYMDGGGMEKVPYISYPLDDGTYHVISLTRSGNSAQLRIDNNYGPWTDVAGTGLDNAGTMYIAAPDPWTGQVLYTRLDAEALSADRLSYERGQILGTTILTGYATPLWSTMSRTTVAYETYSNGTMAVAPVNSPRISGSGGGLLVEPAGTNKCLQSETFGSWTQVALTSVSSDSTTAPNDVNSADGSVGTAVDTQHGFSQAVTLTAAYYTITGYVKPGNFNWVYLSDSTVANAYAYFNITNGYVGTVGAGVLYTYMTPSAYGFYRVGITVLGTAAAHTLQYYTAEADTDNSFTGDAATINTYWWGSQVELGYFPTSYIGPTTTGQVVRTADYRTLDPHIASSNKRIFPETMCATCSANKVTIQLDVKCQSSTGVSAAASSKNLIVISDTGTTTNTIQINVGDTGVLSFNFWDNAATNHYATSAVAFDYSKWNTFKLFIDLADMSRTKLTANGAAIAYGISGGLSGTAIWNTTNTIIRLAQYYYGTPNGFCNIRNLIIEPREF